MLYVDFYGKQVKKFMINLVVVIVEIGWKKGGNKIDIDTDMNNDMDDDDAGIVGVFDGVGGISGFGIGGLKQMKLKKD